MKPELMESYLQVRAERWLNLTSVVFNKWGIKKLFDEAGKTIQLDSQTKHPVISPVVRVVVNASHPLRMYFEQVRRAIGVIGRISLLLKIYSLYQHELRV